MNNLDRFIKMIEDGVGITDVVLFNCARAEIQGQIEKSKKYDDIISFVPDDRSYGVLVEDSRKLESQVVKLKEELETMTNYIDKNNLTRDSNVKQVAKLKEDNLRLIYDIKRRELNEESQDEIMKQLKSTLNEIKKSGRELSLADSSHSVSTYFVIDKEILAKHEDEK